jgi:hypothetical protein
MFLSYSETASLSFCNLVLQNHVQGHNQYIKALVTDDQNNMPMESTEPYTEPESTEPSTPPGPMTTTSREVVPITRKATKSRSKTKAKKSMGIKGKRGKPTTKNTKSKKKIKTRKRTK